MRRHLLELEEVAALVRSGATLLLAGDEPRLRLLPPGRWIAGTIPYFIGDEGGTVDRQRIFAEELPPALELVDVARYDEERISRVYADLPPDGMGIAIVPAESRVHLSFALNAPRYDRFATAPLFGWVSGVHLSELGAARPKAFDGTTGEALDADAVVMRVRIAPGHRVELGIVNIFEMGDGPAITFPSTGFAARTASVDGRPRDFAEYVGSTGLDTRLPLVADYHGARINVSFQSVDLERGEVRFFAPVFAGVVYRHAKPIADCVEAFASAIPRSATRDVALSCNCVLNYLNCGLEGRRTGDVVGPTTFGEIAYQLLNQTMVYLTVSGPARASGG